MNIYQNLEEEIKSLKN